MNDFLLEIGLEEVPARFLNQILLNLKENLIKELIANSLDFKEIKTFATYRRLAIQVQALSYANIEMEKEIKGPPVKFAFNEQKQIQPAGLGFLKKINKDLALNLTEGDLQNKDWQLYTHGQIKFGIKTENSVDYLNAIIKEKVKPLLEILQNILPQVICGINLPIAMRWGEVGTPFIRPVHWILALLNQQIVEFELFGIKSGNFSFGHRFLTKNTDPDLMAHGKLIIIEAPSDYQKIMQANFVIVDTEARKAMIKKFVQDHTDLYDEELLEEVTNLVEFPQGLIGEFASSFLVIPQNILIECMKKHQKFFPILDQGNLSHRFIVIADNITRNNTENVIKGNQAVLLARLEDAKFFWEEDRKKPLDYLNEKLKSMVFQKNVGSLFDKKERIKKIS
ncbi:MAG: glycine--tRNA ligase subunit beta, partial [Candidatus Margulisiibacteriota bacterium]